jgi:hypothetical protein
MNKVLVSHTCHRRDITIFLDRSLFTGSGFWVLGLCSIGNLVQTLQHARLETFVSTTAAYSASGLLPIGSQLFSLRRANPNVCLDHDMLPLSPSETIIFA